MTQSNSVRLHRSRLAIAIAACWPLLLAAECEPTAPMCGVSETDCENDGGVVVCLNTCVPLPTRDDALGKACSSDPCDPNVLNGTYNICPYHCRA